MSDLTDNVLADAVRESYTKLSDLLLMAHKRGISIIFRPNLEFSPDMGAYVAGRWLTGGELDISKTVSL